MILLILMSPNSHVMLHLVYLDKCNLVTFKSHQEIIKYLKKIKKLCMYN